MKKRGDDRRVKEATFLDVTKDQHQNRLVFTGYRHYNAAHVGGEVPIYVGDSRTGNDRRA